MRTIASRFYKHMCFESALGCIPAQVRQTIRYLVRQKVLVRVHCSHYDTLRDESYYSAVHLLHNITG